MSEFKSTSNENGSNVTLAFQGTIDEDVEFPSVATGKYSTITLDLKGVKAINSVGIRE
jgi:anti-anti-sigma regulatory factor